MKVYSIWWEDQLRELHDFRHNDRKVVEQKQEEMIRSPFTLVVSEIVEEEVAHEDDGVNEILKRLP